MIDNDQRLYVEANEAARDQPKEWNTIKNNVEVTHTAKYMNGEVRMKRSCGQKYREVQL
jgi:hypothetical protein